MEQNLPDHERPLSEQFRIAAEEWVDAYAAFTLLDNLKQETFAKMVRDEIQAAFPDHMPTNRAETIVRASDEWIEYKTRATNAGNESTRLKVQVEYLRMKFSEWQSLNANAREERRITR